jgi:hypothetical protein
MCKSQRSKTLRELVHTCLDASFAAPIVLQAQPADASGIDKVAVTGSSIRNSAFAKNSPVASLAAGATSAPAVAMSMRMPAVLSSVALYLRSVN